MKAVGVAALEAMRHAEVQSRSTGSYQLERASEHLLCGACACAGAAVGRAELFHAVDTGIRCVGLCWAWP